MNPITSIKRGWSQRITIAVCALALAAPIAARAHGTDPSTASSALSMLPIAVSVVAPSVVLVGGAALTVVAVEASARGTVVMFERASDAAAMSVTLAGQASMAVGTVVFVTAISTGWVLSHAGKALCFIPNELGTALLHNERISR